MLCRKFLRSLENIPLAAVAHEKNQVQCSILPGLFFQSSNPLLKSLRQTRKISENTETHSVLHEHLHLRCNGIHHQMHEEVDFLLRSAPVFFGKSIERQVLHTCLGSSFRHDTHRLHAFFMAEDTFMPLFTCPPSVSIHYNGYMDGDSVLIFHLVFLISVAVIPDVLAPEQFAHKSLHEVRIPEPDTF